MFCLFIFYLPLANLGLGHRPPGCRRKFQRRQFHLVPHPLGPHRLVPLLDFNPFTILSLLSALLRVIFK